ncbi:unnamed protein product [Durusdinium trenchii]|uniref:HEAT repeat domain-containing protein n=2 Tax=Durusdinium trenchii TaxID=1381693 RepID=A0ABP0LS04_9DINO
MSMAPLGDDIAADISALHSSSALVRLAALSALRGRPVAELQPFAEQLLPMVADSVSEVRMLACELVASLEQPGGTPAVPLQGNAREDVPAEPVVREDEQAKALRCGKTWKCLCVPGFGVEPYNEDEMGFADYQRNQPAAEASSSQSPQDFVWPRADRVGRKLPAWKVPKTSSPKSQAEGQDEFVSPALENYLSSEPELHWVVRDALAFTPKPLQGDVLIRLLANHDSGVRQSVLLALRRLVPIYWSRHADRVSEMLLDRIPEIRMAALIALFHLDASDLERQAPKVVASLRDKLWPVREAALQTLRKLRPQQLCRWSHQVLRCKLDWHLRVRCAAQRVLERLDPGVLADLACRGARGGVAHKWSSGSGVSA